MPPDNAAAPQPAAEPDERLLARWLAGEVRAFDGLVARHAGALLAHARALLRDPAAAEDQVQETFLRLLAKPPELRGFTGPEEPSSRSLLSSWLHRVTHNLCMDALRSSGRRQRRETEQARPEAVPSEALAVEAEDTRAAVERGLARLPAAQREVLALRLFGEQSYKQIAALTGKQIGTVGWLIAEGLKSLSRDLNHWLPQGVSSAHDTRAGEGAGS
jgi:RNA polymerase sigma-70 factor (ECF subfamily)